MPVNILTAYSVMLPILHAEESLNTINIGALAAGNLKKKAQQKIINNLEKAMNARQSATTQSSVNKYARLEALGIPVIRVGKKKNE